MTLPLPANVEDLLDRYLRDFEHLEIALFLRSNSSRGWTSAELTSALPMPEELLMQALSELQTDGLICVVPEDALRHRYAPRTRELEAAMTDLSVIYRDNRVAVISRLSMNAINRIRLRTVRAFSEAFVVSRDRKGGGGGEDG